MAAAMAPIDAWTGWILGWTLIHSIWQGALVAGGLALILRFLPEAMARLRGAVCWGALALLIGLGPVTWLLIATELRTHTACWESETFVRDNPLFCASHAVPVVHTGLDAGLGEDWKDQVARSASWVSRMALPVPPSVRAASLEATGVVALLAVAAGVIVWIAMLRLVLGLVLLRGVRGRARPFLDSELEGRLWRLARQLDIGRPVELRVSDEIATPAVAGWRRPVILMPRDVADVLTPEQLDDVLIHELVHVRDRHFIVNLGQRTLDCLCAFNPFTLWISGRIREEREACCDRVAAGPPSSRRRYVETLLQLEGLRRPASPTLLGLVGEGDLLRRIRRLVAAPAPRPAPRLCAGALAGAVALVTVGLVAQLSLTTLSLTTWSVMSCDIEHRRTATATEVLAAATEALAAPLIGAPAGANPSERTPKPR